MIRLQLILLLVVVLLAACSSSPIETKVEAEEVGIISGGKANYYSILTDNETGCQYIEAYEHSPSNGRTVSITPRYSADGKQICEQPLRSS